jgi:hypothetical protein
MLKLVLHVVFFIMNKLVGNGWVYGPFTHGSQKSNNGSKILLWPTNSFTYLILKIFKDLKAEGYLKVQKVTLNLSLWLFRVWGNHYVP